jgi:hypothetical protein
MSKVERFYFKSRTPVTIRDIMRWERVGNEIYITMCDNEVKTFAYKEEKDAELEMKDFLSARND